MIRLISVRVAANFERIAAANSTDKTRDLKEELAFTEEELEKLRRARTMPISFGVDCPDTTPERAKRFRRVNPVRRTAN